MREKFLIFHLFFIVNLYFELQGQDIHFSQFRTTHVLINPAQTSLNKTLRFTTNYKDQWRSVGSPFKTFAFSGEAAIKNKDRNDGYAGVGLQFLQDKAGDSQMSTSSALLSFSGIVNMSRLSKLSIGIIGGFGQRSMNYNNLQWGNQYTNGTFNSNTSSNEQQGAVSYLYPEIGSGMCWSYGKEQRTISSNDGVKIVLGVSAWHFSIPRYSFSGLISEKLNTKYIAHGNMQIGLMNKNIIIGPEFLYMRQGTLQEINLGTVFKFIFKEESKYTGIIKASALSLGANYRYKDAVIISFLYEYSNYGIGLSYDSNISRLMPATNSRGGLEISLYFVTPRPYNKSGTSFYRN